MSEHPTTSAAAVAALRDFLGRPGGWPAPPGRAAFVRSTLAGWSRYGDLSEVEVEQVVAAYLTGGTPTEQCVTCAEPIEHVPTPPGGSPEWHPPYWRHVDPGRLHGLLPTRPARTGETAGGAS